MFASVFIMLVLSGYGTLPCGTREKENAPVPKHVRVLGQERPTFKFLNEPALLRCHPILAGFAPRPLVICQHIPALFTETLSVAPTAYAIKFTPYGLVCPQRPIPAHSCSAPLPPNAVLSGKAGDRGGTYALSLVWQYSTPAVGWLSTRFLKKF